MDGLSQECKVHGSWVINIHHSAITVKNKPKNVKNWDQKHKITNFEENIALEVLQLHI